MTARAMRIAMHARRIIIQGLKKPPAKSQNNFLHSNPLPLGFHVPTIKGRDGKLEVTNCDLQ